MSAKVAAGMEAWRAFMTAACPSRAQYRKAARWSARSPSTPASTSSLATREMRLASTEATTEARLATGLLVGSSYLFGAVGNLWATRGRHPGWVLYTIALILIVYGIGKPGT
jgi:hypothetical protein